MATNFEFYKDEILGYVEEYASFPAFVNGKLVTCVSGDCQQCIFRSPNCFAKRVEWLYAEHIEQPKLTKRERAFCELMRDGYIARDKGGAPIWFRSLPQKSKEHSMWITNSYLFKETLTLTRYMDVFSFIKWEDEKPWAVEDLLELEVME